MLIKDNELLKEQQRSFKRDLGQQLRALRENRGFSIVEAENYLRKWINIKDLEKCENGAIPSLELVFIIARFYGKKVKVTIE